MPALICRGIWRHRGTACGQVFIGIVVCDGYQDTTYVPVQIWRL